MSPTQARILLRAWNAEEARIRHEAESWPDQAARDASERDRQIKMASDAGVDWETIVIFIYAEHGVYDDR